MKYRRWTIVLLTLYPLLCGFDVNNLTQQEAEEWSNAIHTEMKHLQEITPQAQQNAYYWYLYGTLRQAIGTSKLRYSKLVSDRLKAALPACDGLYEDDPSKAEDCRQRLKGLMPDEFFKDR